MHTGGVGSGVSVGVVRASLDRHSACRAVQCSATRVVLGMRCLCVCAWLFEAYSFDSPKQSEISVSLSAALPFIARSHTGS
jgi:hypothetical protein